MRVSELIDILGDHPPDAEVELSIIAPVDADATDITVDRYPIDGVMPWDDADEGASVWLIGGDADDVDVFLDAVEQSTD